MLERLNNSPQVGSHCLSIHRPGVRPVYIALCLVSNENRLSPAVVRLFLNMILLNTLGVELHMSVRTFGGVSQETLVSQFHIAIFHPDFK